MSEGLMGAASTRMTTCSALGSGTSVTFSDNWISPSEVISD
jgi:hypothetical protein